jgi:hypothetical protein
LVCIKPGFARSLFSFFSAIFSVMNTKQLIPCTMLGLFLCLGFSSCQKADAPTERTLQHLDGSIKRRYTMIKGKIEGEMLDYYPKTGTIQIKRYFRNGVQIGRTELFYPDGKLKEVQHYQNGKKQKGDTLFYTNGQPQFLVTFKDGKMDGPMRRWTETGELYFEAFYAQDSLKQVTRKLGEVAKQ